MGTEWCVENSLRWCSAHPPHGHLLSRPSFFRFLCFLVSIRRFYSSFPSTDDDTTQYLTEALAASSQDQGQGRSATDVKNALEETRTRKETMELGFEDRVSAALSILGV